MSSPPAVSSVARSVDEDRRYIALHVGQKGARVSGFHSETLNAYLALHSSSDWLRPLPALVYSATGSPRWMGSYQPGRSLEVRTSCFRICWPLNTQVSRRTNAYVVYVVAPAGALLGLGRVMLEPWWYARHKAFRLRTHEPVVRRLILISLPG
jgi:hypothetical protein